MQISKPTFPSQQCVILYPLVFICSLNSLFLREYEKEIIFQACPLNYSTSCHLIKKPAVINKTTLSHSPAIANLRRSSLSPRLSWKGSEIHWQPQIPLSAPANIPARSTAEPNRDRNADFSDLKVRRNRMDLFWGKSCQNSVKKILTKAEKF